MAEQPLRIDELTSRTPLGTDYLPTTPTGGPSGRATVAEIVSAGLPAGQAATDILAWSTGTNTWAPLPVDLLVQSGLPQGHHQADLLAWSTATNRWAPLPFAPFAVNIAAGAAGSIPYQTAADHTAMLPIGTTGQVLTVGAGGPKWQRLSDLNFNIATLAAHTTDVDDSSLLCGSFSNWDDQEYMEIPIQCVHVKLDGLLASKTINIQNNMGGAPAFQTFSAASLVSAGVIVFGALSGLTQLNIPNLLECEGFYLTGCTSIQRITLPCHTYNGDLQVSSNDALNYLVISKAMKMRGIQVAFNPNLRNFQLPADLKLYGQEISLQGNALNNTNGILNTIASWDGKEGRHFWGGPGKFVNLSGGTNAVPTSGEPFHGVESAQTLIARGCTVTVNGTAITTTKKSAFAIPDFDTVADKGKTLKVKADGTGLEWVA